MYYGKTADGSTVDEYTLTNAHSMEVKILTYGGIITSLRVPNRRRQLDNVVLGLNQLADYETKSAYFGAIIGRYGNRIGGSTFVLDGHDGSWQWLMDGENKGKLESFARVRLTKE